MCKQLYLDVDANFFSRIPHKFDNIEVAIVLDNVVDTVRKRHVDFRDTVAWSRHPPSCDLLALHVLKSSLVKAQSNDTLCKFKKKCKY